MNVKIVFNDSLVYYWHFLIRVSFPSKSWIQIHMLTLHTFLESLKINDISDNVELDGELITMQSVFFIAFSSQRVVRLSMRDFFWH